MQLQLPRPVRSTSVTVEAALRARRSCREYSVKSILLEDISRLLWAAQGVTGEDGKKAAPSAGGQYPLQLYLVAGAISELAIGLYRYDGEIHSLQVVSGDDPRAALCEAALEDQPWVGTAASIIVVTASFAAARDHVRAQPPLGERGDRYVYIETGAVAENVHLQATGLGVGCVLVGGFDDAKVKGTLNLPQELEPTALLCLGAVS